MTNNLKTKIVIYTSKILLLAFIGGFFWFVTKVQEFSNNPPKIPPKVDAVVVITGGKGRIEEAFKLINNGIAKKILISGVSKEFSLEDLKKTFKNKESVEILKNKVTLGRIAATTMLNVIETDMWLQFNEFKSFILVTSDYHAVRTDYLFKTFLPNMEYYIYPINSSNFKINKWWDFPGTFKLIFVEYVKYIFTILAKIFDMVDLL